MPTKNNDRFEVEESVTPPMPPAGLPKGIAKEIFAQPGSVNVIKPRGPSAALLQSENEELKGQLEQLQAMLNQRSTNALDVQTSTFAIGESLLTPTGLHVPENFSYEAWEQIGHIIFRLEGAIQWLIGDWLIYGSDLQYGDVKQIADVMGRDEKTFYNLMTTCRSVESSRRREVLSFAHHSEVTKMTSEDQEYTLKFAAQNRFNVKQFRRWIKLGMPEAGLPEELPSSAPQKADDPVTLTAGSYARYYHADPAKAKPREREQAVEVYHQMVQSMEEYRRKWGI